jgi:23S rRNA (uracil1939-C5)-methyltransferase
VVAGDPWRYRNRIRLAVDGAGRVGYRARRSHDVVPIAECPIAAPLLVEAALRGAEILRTSKGAFRAKEISLFCNADETALLASVFVRGGATDGFEAMVREWKKDVAALVGVELAEEGVEGRAPAVMASIGEGSLNYKAGGFDYRVDHGAFFQVNRWVMDEFVDRVVADRRGELAWDLFAGVGLFARRLTDTFARVTAVESAPASTDALAWNLRGTRGEGVEADIVSFLKGRERAAARPDLIVVDPPRTGLGMETTSLLAGVGAATMVYVSCDPATLARDLRALIEAGYAIDSMTLADLFPQTFHLESVVDLRRC